MKVFIYLLILLSLCSGFFIKYPFGNKFTIRDKEINKKLNYVLPPEKQSIINKINGTYALIGPDVNIKNISTIIDLFMGDGNIQSVFFNNGELTFDKHFIRTEKIIYEEENGKLPDIMMLKVLFDLLYNIKLFPNIMGVANTALIRIKNQLYALYERDTPYLLDLNLLKTKIATLHKIKIPNMRTFSAHSKYNKTIETIDYDILSYKVYYHQLTEEFNSIKNKMINTKYMPVIHDFIKTENSVIIMDSPLVIDIPNLFKNPLPIMLDNTKKTIINVLNTTTMNIEKYFYNEGFYIFHYADWRETNNTIEIYASMYDKLDFSQLDISGKYRKMILNKENKNVMILKNPELEKLDMEFPVKFDDKIVFRSMVNKRITGFVICKDLDIIKKLDLSDKFISGEPAIVYIDKTPHLIAFTFDDKIENQGFVIVINMNTYEIIEIPLNESINIGFHSIFINNETNL
jgi:hypothetical protein